jgi:hypothetical protein
MSRRIIVELEVSDVVPDEQVHEALCLILHEGYAYDDTPAGQGWIINVGKCGSSGPALDEMDRTSDTEPYHG